ncbi:hypothetical protein ACTIVE_3318 [Actinomadura verrucosospora]|uniref:Uncharacterized protein n=1 Tax=Actinomadura verrucosospora TaxID=46165 RepID=A0A7D3VSE2_ACTVE|nr:hypothetical protein ACTIVE_3318 [Actinomadura verrucosospora]
MVSAADVAAAGKSVPITAKVSTSTGVAKDVHVVSVVLSASNGAAKPSIAGACQPAKGVANCDLGSADSTPPAKSATWSLTVPKTLKKKIAVKVTVTVKGTLGGAESSATDWARVTFTPLKTASPTPTTSKPSKTKSPSPSKSASPSPSASATGGKHGSSSGSGGSGGSGSTGGTASGTTSGTGYVPPSPNSSFQAKNPQVALPPIAAPSPSVAPSTVAVTPESRLRGNKTPVAQDLTFERVASTQVAWLAALMVAIAVLLTQLRLGKRRAPAGAAAIARRAKGVHRRTRRGMFGK